MKYIIKFKYFFLILIVAVLASYSLLYPGMIPTHDGEYHVIRFYEFDKVLRSGVIYPRWAPDLNNGLGVPLFNYVYPLPNYFSSFLHLFGFSFIDTFKLNMFFATILGSIFFFLWAKKFWGNLGGIIGSIVYTFSPYHFVDIYIRGSVGEVWALAIFPAFLWAITVFVKERKNSFLILSSVFFSLLVFSHNILALMFFIFSIFYIAILTLSEKKRKEIAIKTASIFILGLFLSSIFWIPALLEKKYVVGLEIFDIKANFPELYQLIFPSWGSGFSGSYLQNQMSFQLGIANILAFIISLIFLFKKKKEFLVRLFFTITFLIVVALMLRFSYPIWVNLPLLNYFQFPWRLLSLAILISSFLAASIVSQGKKGKIIFSALFILLSLGLNFQYAKPAYYMQRTDSYYTTRPNFIKGTNSIGNSFNTAWFKSGVREEKTNFKKLNIAYFPGWKVLINGKETKIWPSKEGKIEFALPKGKYDAKVYFEDTQVRKISAWISGLAFLFILVWFLNLTYVKLKK
ncbi:MAG: hypothetical protein A2W22_05235 [Candidatus Levybacteria bacterium RBG_16_35_11]|nr:MAG: hypothetical protein A2W22_05235 [Candidatus Levybacteria bacterium RBG_16_35_11]